METTKYSLHTVCAPKCQKKWNGATVWQKERRERQHSLHMRKNVLSFLESLNTTSWIIFIKIPIS